MKPTAPAPRAIVPYLFFNGRAEEAIDLYRQALGAELLVLMRFRESPEAMPPDRLPAGFADKVMHATLRVGHATVMLSDGCEAAAPSFQGFHLAASFLTAAEADDGYARLAEGGQVVMPMAKTFWSPRFGMVTDRFGVTWMLSVEATAEPFLLTRTIPAPLEQVWRAWTEREALLQWFGPKGMSMTAAKLDFRTDGRLHYGLRASDGKEMWGRFIYREIIAPERIVWISCFSNPEGGLAPAPFPGLDWPLESANTVTFAPVAEGTRVTLTSQPVQATEAQCATFTSALAGMRQGWTGTLDQLEAYLAAR